MTNFDLSLHVFSFLKQAGVTTLVVCAGARNAPMVLALRGQGFHIFNFFEERSAAFFAMGLIKAGQQPVAVLTTSGTAVAELLPAAVEATYQGLPLILITADRPRSYRGTGAPQTIEQPGIFSKYVESCYDLDVLTSEFDFVWSRKKPLHLNVAYDEPLIDEASGQTIEAFFHQPVPAIKPAPAAPILRPLIVVGGLDAALREQAAAFILKSGAPVYAESVSGLRNYQALKEQMLFSSDQVVNQIFRKGLCDGVIRLGGVPTLRFWRDLEAGFRHVPVSSYTDLPFSGLARASGVAGFAELQSHAEFPPEILMQIKKMDADLQLRKEQLLIRYPKSEQSLVRGLSEKVGAEPLYVGNSLPIRNWDQFASCASAEIYANRGANGIDGQVSTYLGWSQFFNSSYCFIGDLTALYDLAALGLTSQLNQNRRCLVVMNNYGGRIFSRVFKNDDFINSHSTQFKNWAQMWSWNYLQVTDLDQLKQNVTDSSVYQMIEIVPDLQQTQLFWNEWDEVCHLL